MGETAQVGSREYILSFIEKVNKEVYVPIFIFSNENVDNIISHLQTRGLFISDKLTNIFVKNKSELMDTEQAKGVLFREIDKWLKGNPSIYVLKEWENATKSAKTDLFWSFSKVHHQWPSALKKAFEADGSDPSHELGALIFKNIIARTSPIDFDDNIVCSACDTIGKEDIRKVLENERYLPVVNTDEKPSTGCLLRIPRGGNSPCNDYFLNIRPDCDIARPNRDRTYDPQLYCLKGKVVTDEDKLKTEFDKGALLEKANIIYLPFVDEGKILKFELNDIHLKTWSQVKNNRIGRVLHPYITRIQQKYAFYLQRQGVPGLPNEVFEIAKPEVVSETD
jgi:hypothetical protein